PHDRPRGAPAARSTPKTCSEHDQPDRVRAKGSSSMSSHAEPQVPSPDASPATTRLKDEIEHTRSDLSDTVAALEQKLAPSQVREAVSAELQLVEDRVRDVLGDQLTQAKTLVETEMLEAKEFLRTGLTDAERMIRAGLSDARESVRTDVKDALTGVR